MRVDKQIFNLKVFQASEIGGGFLKTQQAAYYRVTWHNSLKLPAIRDTWVVNKDGNGIGNKDFKCQINISHLNAKFYVLSAVTAL